MRSKGIPRKLTDGRLPLGTRLAAGHLGHALQPPDCPDNLVEAGLILDLDAHRPEDRPVLGRELGALDVGAGLADGSADVGAQAAPALATHREPHADRLAS